MCVISRLLYSTEILIKMSMSISFSLEYSLKVILTMRSGDYKINFLSKPLVVKFKNFLIVGLQQRKLFKNNHKNCKLIVRVE